jgi:hypothetical protein
MQSTNWKDETMQSEIADEFRALIAAARRVSDEVGKIVADVLKTGVEAPLPAEEARALLTRVVEVMRARALGRDDTETVAVLDREEEALIERLMDARARIAADGAASAAEPAVSLVLQPYNGIPIRAVRPKPVFHEQEVPVWEGFVRTRDVKLWDENERLDIHLNQFQQANGRRPNAEELLDIMTGTMTLPGLDVADQFSIQDLARSIAVNGVRKPPIIDVDGTLLDGNRRVCACYYILNSDGNEFSADEKSRAEWLQVWQLTEHATRSDRDAVIVSLNFEPDYKQDWPQYVKARKVYEQWRSLLALEARANPNNSRQKEIKREIARKFALGADEVNRYIQMVMLAEDFEDYHVADRHHDKYAVKHHAERYFQYFDELGKGKGAGGVYWSLNQDEPFKHLVYDLLYDGKFQNWNKIRDLKYVYGNEDALACLKRARAEEDVEAGQELVNDACSLARSVRADQRQLGANTRVKVFADWFKDLPVKSFSPDEPSAITRENLHALHDVLRLVQTHLTSAADVMGGGARDAG